MTVWIAAHVSHFSTLVPAACVALRRVSGREYVLVAFGLAVSFLADVGALLTGHSWAITEWYPAVQFSLLSAAFGGWAVVLLLPWIALLQAWGMPGPDMMVTAIGSVAVLYLSARHALHASMLWYCGVASLLWLLMIPARAAPDLFMWFWWPYQAARLTAFALFVVAAWRVPTPVEAR